MPVLPEVLGEHSNPVGQQRDLHLGRTGVAGVTRVIFDDRLLTFCRLH